MWGAGVLHLQLCSLKGQPRSAPQAIGTLHVSPQWSEFEDPNLNPRRLGTTGAQQYLVHSLGHNTANQFTSAQPLSHAGLSIKSTFLLVSAGSRAHSRLEEEKGPMASLPGAGAVTVSPLISSLVCTELYLLIFQIVSPCPNVPAITGKSKDANGLWQALRDSVAESLI